MNIRIYSSCLSDMKTVSSAHHMVLPILPSEDARDRRSGLPGPGLCNSSSDREDASTEIGTVRPASPPVFLKLFDTVGWGT